MIWVTDINKTKVAINPKYVIAVFKIFEGEYSGKTSVNLINGQLIVEESDYDIVGMMQ